MVNSYGMNVNHLVGGWYTYPPEKYEFVNWDECSQYMETNVSKHQPVLLLRSSFELLHARCQKSHECCFKSICHCPVTRKFMKILTLPTTLGPNRSQRPDRRVARRNLLKAWWSSLTGVLWNTSSTLELRSLGLQLGSRKIEDLPSSNSTYVAIERGGAIRAEI